MRNIYPAPYPEVYADGVAGQMCVLMPHYIHQFSCTLQELMDGTFHGSALG
jgi:hypothetical protein